jgi:kinesin family member C1
LKIKEEKLKSYLNRNEHLEEMNKKLQSQNEAKDNEIMKLKKEISQLITEKENLSNEIRKLSRTQNLQQDHSHASSSSSSSSSASQSLWGQMTVASRELARAEETINSLNHEIIELKTSLSAMTSQLERSQQQQEEMRRSQQDLQELEQEKEKRIIADNQLINAQQENSDLVHRMTELEKSFVSSQERHAEEIAALQLENQRLQAIHSVSTPQGTSQSLREGSQSESSDSSSWEMGEASYQSALEELKEKLFESERSRRKLHNKLQDLKGNVRVYVRCRPFLSSDYSGEGQQQQEGDERENRSCVNCNADGTTVTLSEHCQRGGGQVYQFDQVYGSGKTQYEVFKDVSDFIQSALDGYRVCVFSYGQTGSGKVSSHSPLPRSRSHPSLPQPFRRPIR